MAKRISQDETAPSGATTRKPQLKLSQYMPILNWLPNYQRNYFVGDLLAGVIVAIMLVPQGMAYALLAGLPPEVGLYAGILPLILYGIFGTSRSLAVGPVAIASLMVAAGVMHLAEPGSSAYLQYALTLALLVGLLQAVMGLLRVGFLVNFLSHPVLVGFTAGAAILIGFSQLKHLLGVSIPRTEYFYESVLFVAAHIGETSVLTVAIGLVGIGLLLYFKYGLGKQLKQWGVSNSLAVPIAKSGPLVVVLLGTLLVWGLGLHESAHISIVGDVPGGLPSLTLPTFELPVLQALLPTAIAISMVGYMESISVAKSLASKRRQRIDANQELIALGVANLGATFTGGYPVTGGFSRSVVNFSAGANTGMASIITAVLIALTVIFLTPFFYFLPNAMLAAIILVAVANLIDIKSIKHVWRYNKRDAAALFVTFFAVLAVGVETGILIGVGAAIALFIWRSSKPHVAVVGRLGDSETYRNVLRHPVQTWPHVVIMRMDENLYFANTKYLEDTVLNLVAECREIEYFVLVGTAVNVIDASALETLESLIHQLKDAGVAFHLAAIKGPVMDKLLDIGFVNHIGADHIHLTTHDAMKAIGVVAE
ncbi:MAG: solute carrier family 26 protein [Anaerolineales bacterium]|nr:solute carrier family 26 protein [Anaerolineales bacterium]